MRGEWMVESEGVKVCRVCGEEKPLSDFHKTHARCKPCYKKDYASKPEVRERRRENEKKRFARPEVRERRRENEKKRLARPEVKERARESRKKHHSKPEVRERLRGYGKKHRSKPEVRELRREYARNYNSKPRAKERRKESYKENRERKLKSVMISSAKARAKKKGLPFDLTESDFDIPKTCPVLGIPLRISEARSPKDHSPSLDRVIPGLGYVKHNVRVISMRANVPKQDLWPDELQKIADYTKRETPLVIAAVVALEASEDEAA
jgi:hypothetical protein